MKKFDHQKIEKKWQKKWQEEKIYVAGDKSKKPKKYILVEFPYPSGEGLHMGHLRPYTAGDVYSRYFRMRGGEVLFPIGWDAFGLPAENYAINRGIQPALTTAKNIKNAKRQLVSWGMSFDWSREINTTDPEYYKWTQWIFLQLYKAGLAYQATAPINWCPMDKTGLANEEVINGRCERCGAKVEKKELRQWYLKITAYAEKLLAGLKNLNWPEQVKIQQENWIGRSEGALIKFSLQATSYLPRRPAGKPQASIEVFTTRADTLFGATYLVLAPEHPLIKNFQFFPPCGIPRSGTIFNFQEVEEYIKKTKDESEMDRLAVGREKTGVELKGVKAINPATKEKIPVWIADYVLPNYGTGAIMAVPAHDERDHEFALKFGLPVIEVVAESENRTQNSKVKSQNGNSKPKTLKQTYEGHGILANSGKYTGMDSEKAGEIMTCDFGKAEVQYKLRDWVFSRQRYWGEPIPMIHCEKCGTVPVPEKDLPVKLPKVKNYQPTGTGKSPLAVMERWVNVKCPKCDSPARRETDTMPQWAGSSWYFLRYLDPRNRKEIARKELMKKWLPVDVYFGGMEHTTLHLLYSRFWNLFLYDQDAVPVSEPYRRRIPHGIMLAENGEKMSKSRGNVVNPDSIVKQFGADTLRVYELFLGPHEMAVSWNSRGIIGVKRFLDKVYRLAYQLKPESDTKETELPEDLKAFYKQARSGLHQMIKKVEEDIENIKFNTAVSAMMSYIGQLQDLANREPLLSTRLWQDFCEFLKVVAPLAPHLAEEIWRHVFGFEKSIHLEKWPTFRENYIADELIDLVVQVNGRMREIIRVKKGVSRLEAERIAFSSQKIQKYIERKKARKVIFVPDRIINIVI